MKVTVRFFASLREALGSGETLDLAAGATVGDLRDVLMQRSAGHADALGRDRALRCALNQILCNESTPLPDACEVAFFPPVTGG
ncbi:MAG: MoaD/ThiS family protein [Burkholderiales bacterium]|nr:MoaD/ThiS family protein [Burkholderiales bacterium]